MVMSQKRINSEENKLNSPGSLIDSASNESHEVPPFKQSRGRYQRKRRQGQFYLPCCVAKNFKSTMSAVGVRILHPYKQQFKKKLRHNRNGSLVIHNTHQQQIMMVPLRSVNHQIKSLTLMVMLLEPIFENGKPQRLDVELRQLQKPLQVSTTTVKLNRLSKQGG